MDVHWIARAVVLGRRRIPVEQRRYAFATGRQRAPDDCTTVMTPSWLHDYSWLYKLDLPPHKKRTAVEKLSSSLVLAKEDILRIAHAKEVARARTTKRSASTWK